MQRLTRVVAENRRLPFDADVRITHEERWGRLALIHSWRLHVFHGDVENAVGLIASSVVCDIRHRRRTDRELHGLLRDGRNADHVRHVAGIITGFRGRP